MAEPPPSEMIMLAELLGWSRDCGNRHAYLKCLPCFAAINGMHGRGTHHVQIVFHYLDQERVQCSTTLFEAGDGRLLPGSSSFRRRMTYTSRLHLLKVTFNKGIYFSELERQTAISHFTHFLWQPVGHFSPNVHLASRLICTNHCPAHRWHTCHGNLPWSPWPHA